MVVTRRFSLSTSFYFSFYKPISLFYVQGASKFCALANDDDDDVDEMMMVAYHCTHTCVTVH